MQQHVPVHVAETNTAGKTLYSIPSFHLP